MVNDSFYRIGQAYYYLEEDNLSVEYINSHLNKRKKGQKSLYSKKEVINFLKKVTSAGA
jgi:hypothetical protein